MFRIIFCVFLLCSQYFAKENFMIIAQLNEEKFNITLENNKASAEFLTQLLLELSFSDYVHKEKIAYLEKPLSIKHTNGYAPKIGDFFYYSPWGNIGIFYEKQSPASGLVYLGKVDKKLVEKLKNTNSDFKLKIYELK